MAHPFGPSGWTLAVFLAGLLALPAASSIHGIQDCRCPTIEETTSIMRWMAPPSSAASAAKTSDREDRSAAAPQPPAPRVQTFVVGDVFEQAVLGGRNTSAGDPISLPTDYLYHQYRTGNLARFDLGGESFQYQSSRWCVAFQDAVYYLEDEITDLGEDALKLVELAIAGAQTHDPTGVRAINLFELGVPREALAAFRPQDRSTWAPVNEFHVSDFLFWMPGLDPNQDPNPVLQNGDIVRIEWSDEPERVGQPCEIRLSKQVGQEWQFVFATFALELELDESGPSESPGVTPRHFFADSFAASHGNGSGFSPQGRGGLSSGTSSFGGGGSPPGGGTPPFQPPVPPAYQPPPLIPPPGPEPPFNPPGPDEFPDPGPNPPYPETPPEGEGPPPWTPPPTSQEPPPLQNVPEPTNWVIWGLLAGLGSLARWLRYRS